MPLAGEEREEQPGELFPLIPGEIEGGSEVVIRRALTKARD
jgi:hypothetical protein